MWTDEYLHGRICYGGSWLTRMEVINDLERLHYTSQEIDRYLQGADAKQHRKEREDEIHG